MIKRGLDWLEDRTGYRGLVQNALNEKVPGGASFAYIFGSVLTFILLLQMTTGVFLAMYYSPSATDAWGSVAHIQDQVTMGWFIRGLHSYGASAMVIVAGLHLMQTAVYGAYKKPRELNWIIGCLMLALILAFALTGYLLPWDQTGYWATKVATGIAGTSPLIGEQLQQVAQGGNEYGNLTLTRFFAIHVFILPAALLSLVGVHIYLFRRHGVTPRWDKTPDELEAGTQPFWPDQLFKDMVGIAVVFAILVGVNLWTHGVKLDGPADPASNFDARPEWYFRPLFQVLKYFSGTMEHVVALGTPVVVGAVLLGLPFVDRGPSRSPKARAKYLAVLALGAVLTVALTVISFQEDRNDPRMQERLKVAHAQAKKARHLAKTYGVPAAGGISVYDREPGARAAKLWVKHCKGCHAPDKETDRKGPLIGPGYNSRDWVRAFLLRPDDPMFFGLTKINKMKPVKQRGAELDALVELVYAETGAADAKGELVKKGKSIFDDACSDCHEIDRYTSGSGPNLGGRGTVEYLEALIAHAADPRFFGKLNDDMPKFRGTISEGDRISLAKWILDLRDQPGGKFNTTPPPLPSEEPKQDKQDEQDEQDGKSAP